MPAPVATPRSVQAGVADRHRLHGSPTPTSRLTPTPTPGWQVYDLEPTAAGSVVGGTSEAAPLIAAYYAVTGVSAPPAWAYEKGRCSTARSGEATELPTSDRLHLHRRGRIRGADGGGQHLRRGHHRRAGHRWPRDHGNYALSTTATGAQLAGGVYPNGIDTTYWCISRDRPPRTARDPGGRHRVRHRPGGGVGLALRARRRGRPTTTAWSPRTRPGRNTATTSR